MSLSINSVSSNQAAANYCGPNGAGANSVSDADGGTYEVGYGDTLDVVAAKTGVDAQALLQANPQIVNPDVLYPYDLLQLPAGCQPAAPADNTVSGDVSSDDTTHDAPHDHSTTDETSSAGTDDGAVDPTKLPLGDGKYSYDGPQQGYIYLDRNSSHIDPNNPAGSSTNGPWIRSDGTYDSTNKVVVEGEVEWPSEAHMTISPDGQTRTISTNDLPGTSGVFPIASDSQAYQYDRNPNSIQVQNLSVELPAQPTANAQSTPLTGGAIGFIYSDASKTSMTALFAAVDEKGNDAVAHEVQDSNKGHPQQSGEYHFHSAPEALKDAEGIIGYALDGFPIMGSMENGQKVTNADLDENHGKMTTIQVDGKEVQTYAYYATDEYPYTIGAFKGTPAQVQGEMAPSQPGTTQPQTGPGETPATGAPVTGPSTNSPPATGQTSPSPSSNAPQLLSPEELDALEQKSPELAFIFRLVQALNDLVWSWEQGNEPSPPVSPQQQPQTEPSSPATPSQPQGVQPPPTGAPAPEQGTQPAQGMQPPPSGMPPPPEGMPPPQGAQPPSQ
jgi:LysM repeat protein